MWTKTLVINGSEVLETLGRAEGGGTEIYLQIGSPFKNSRDRYDNFEAYFESEEVAGKYIPIIESIAKTLAPVSDASGWKTYRNEQYGFEFRYPSQFAVTTPQAKRFSTGLVFLKYLGKEGTNGNATIYISTETDPSKTGSCLVHEGGGKSSVVGALTQTTSTPSGIWYIDRSFGSGMSQQYDGKNFITVRNGKCFEFSLLIHTSNLGVYNPGTVTEFDATEVNSLFPQIFSTFKLIN
ncbi:MAG: hypothetical protein AAB572_02200 [Patescibacteria group bacterium]